MSWKSYFGCDFLREGIFLPVLSMPIKKYDDSFLSSNMAVSTTLMSRKKFTDRNIETSRIPKGEKA